MSKENKALVPCPSKRELELFCLETGLSRAERLRVQRHLAQCGYCRRIFRNLDRFYSLLAQEMQKPITNLAIDFAKTFAPKPVCYGLLVCIPVPRKNLRAAKAYRTCLVFSANGKPGLRKLRDYDLKQIPKEWLALRLYTDPFFGEMSVCLWQRDLVDASPYQLRWSEAEDVLAFNQSGKSCMAMADFTQLDDRLVYLSKPTRNKQAKSRLSTICG